MPTFRHIRTRMMVVYLLLLVLVLAAMLWAVPRPRPDGTQERTEAEFAKAARVLSRSMAQRTDALHQGGEALAGSGAFKQALQDADLPAVESLLAREARRLHADGAMLVSLDGRLLANTHSGGSFGARCPCAGMLREAAGKGGAWGYLTMEGRGYQAVLVPVLAPSGESAVAPKRVAWLGLVATVNDATAQEIQAQSGMPVSVVSLENGALRLLASSLHGDRRSEAEAWLSAVQTPEQGLRRVRLGGREYWAYLVNLDGSMPPVHLAAFTMPVHETSVPPQGLDGTLLLIGALAMLAFLYATSWLSRRMTVPMQELGAAFRRVGRGHYGVRVNLDVNDELGLLAEGFNRMAGELSARERQIAFLAHHDGLTGLPNRSSFVARVNEQMAQDKRSPGVMLVAHLARLPGISAGLGYTVADGLIHAAAQRLQGRDDWQVARLGQERFAVYCPVGAEMNRMAWVDQVRRVLEPPIEWQGQRFELGLRLGSAKFPQDGADAEALLRRAGQAGQRGSTAEGSHVAWKRAFDTEGAERLALLHDLGAAMESGQLLATFQPRIRLSDGRVMGCELLLCWQHPTRGLLRPHEFIAAAQQSALIRHLTRRAIDEAAAQAASWRRGGHDMAVSVNLSSRDLADRAVVEQFGHALSRHGLSPETLLAEIPEHALMEDPDAAEFVVKGLADLGVRVALGEFGIGGSSLARLAGLPLREIKIDRGFVAGMLESARDASIVKATIDLAHTLGLAVVADGVESAEHWQRLVAYGCDAAQGSHLSEPLDAAALDAWLLEREA